MEKMAVLAPMARASVTITVTVNPGWCTNCRMAKRKSCLIVPMATS